MVPDWLDQRVLGASLTRWLLAGATFAAVYFALTLARRLLVGRLGALATRTATGWDDLAVELIRRTRGFFILALALAAATRLLPRVGSAPALRAVVLMAALLQVGLWGNAVVSFAAERYAAKTPGDAAARATVFGLAYVVRLALWVLIAITALDFFDVRITALLTGLGIGGVAVALAAQNVLGDLFAALAIVLDRPFVAGDFIVFDEHKGQVEHIGLKTTRVRSLSGEEIVVANADLLKSRVRNFGRLRERRVAFNLDITYDTPPDRVERVPGIVRDIIGRQTRTRFDRCHLLSFAESALRFETVYFVLDPDYNVYADIQHAVNLELLRRFSQESIAFAFPTRTVVVSDGSDAPASVPARAGQR